MTSPQLISTSGENTDLTDLFEFENLTVSYAQQRVRRHAKSVAVDRRSSLKARPALNELNLQIHAGEVFGLLGPNGSGKSTLLKVLCGLLPIDAGAIRYRGCPWRCDRSYRADLGVVFQSPALDTLLTARENLRLACEMRGLGRGRAAVQRIDDMLALADLEGREDDRVAALSGGMRRRLDVARALLHEPTLLLLDEPSSGIDELSFRRLWTLIKHTKTRRPLSVLVATHRPDEAEHCDRLAFLERGAVVVVDTPEALRGHVAKDVIAIEAADLEAVQERVATETGLLCRAEPEAVLVECDKGHQLIPRIVELFEAGELTAVSLRRPSLADVFHKLTGRGLREESSP